MAEVAHNSIQESGIDRFARGREFIPEPGGHFRLKLPFGDINIFHGHTNGEPRAMVFGVDSPPEVLAGRDDSAKSKGLLSRMEKLAEHPLVKIAAGVALAAGAVVGAGGVLTACSSSADSPHQPVSGHGVQRGPITLENLMNMGGGQPTNWKINSWERHSNMAEIDGKKVIFITHDSWQNQGVDYVKCQAIENCLTAETEIHSLQGLDVAGMWGPYALGGAFQDQEGNNKFIVDASNTFSAQVCDIGPEDSGFLDVDNCSDMYPTIGGEILIFVKGGVPYALSSDVDLYLRNLHTNEIQKIPWGLGWEWGCGLGVETDSAVIASQKQFYQGVNHCRIVVGSSWQELADFPIALKSLNKGSGYVDEVRLAENYLIYRRDGDHWFALIPIDPENPESGEVGAETAGSDTSQSDIPIVDGPDAVDGPETSGADANEADAGSGGTDADEADADPSGTDVNPKEVIEEVANTADAVVETTNSGDSGAQTGQDNGPELPQPIDDGEGTAEVSDNGPTADPGEGADSGQTGQDTKSELPIPEEDIDENSDAEGSDNGSAESDAGSTAEPQPEPTPELDEDAGSESEPAPESQPEQTPGSNPEPVSPSEPQPEQAPEPQPEQAPEPSPEPANTPEPSQSSDAGSSAETANPEPEKEPQPVPWKTVEVDGGCAAVNEHGKPTDPLNHLAPLASLALSLAALGANTRRRVLQTLQAVRQKFKRVA